MTERPQTCRLFFCHWMRNGRPGPRMAARSRQIRHVHRNGGASARGGARCRCTDPLGGVRLICTQFRQWAALGAAKGHQILVFVGDRATAVLPDRDQDLGRVEIGDRIVYRVAGGRIEVDNFRRRPDPVAALLAPEPPRTIPRTPVISPPGRLPENILYFARALRTAGLPVGPGSSARRRGGGDSRSRSRRARISAACSRPSSSSGATRHPFSMACFGSSGAGAASSSS